MVALAGDGRGGLKLAGHLVVELEELGGEGAGEAVGIEGEKIGKVDQEAKSRACSLRGRGGMAAENERM